MRTTDGFEPLDLHHLGELTARALAASADGRPEEASEHLAEAEAAGGGFVVVWSLATTAARAGVLALEPDDPSPAEVVSGCHLATTVLAAASTGRVFDASATFLATSPPVRSASLGALCAVVGHLRASAAPGYPGTSRPRGGGA